MTVQGGEWREGTSPPPHHISAQAQKPAPAHSPHRLTQIRRHGRIHHIHITSAASPDLVAHRSPAAHNDRCWRGARLALQPELPVHVPEQFCKTCSVEAMCGVAPPRPQRASSDSGRNQTR